MRAWPRAREQKPVTRGQEPEGAELAINNTRLDQRVEHYPASQHVVFLGDEHA